MTYIRRHAEESIQKNARMFGAVLVTGPRQVGKTTMLRNILGDIRYVTMDDAVLLANTVENSNTFLKDNPPPLFIDEVQKAPDLFPYIKMSLDESRLKGQFFLSGSQQFQMMKNVTESLSGRIGIITLLGLSVRERTGAAFYRPFLPTAEYLQARSESLTAIPYSDIWQMIWRGSMPELEVNPDFDWNSYYGSYVTTYIERDVRGLAQVGDEIKFTRFMTVLAARNGQLLNLQSIATELGVTQPTIDRWLSILVASHIVYLLQPYSRNLTNRAVKTPKLYFLDTGLAAYLSRWSSAEVLRSGAMSGEYFEAFVISEIIKSYYNAGIQNPPLFFYRDKDKKEIDLIIEQDGVLYPVEIKQHADPSTKDLKNFDVLEKAGTNNIGEGAVICTYDRIMTLRENVRVIPVSYL